MAPVCPDHEICRFSRRHQVRFAHDSAHLRPPGKVKLLTERSVDIEGRGRKAVSGNYCTACPSSTANASNVSVASGELSWLRAMRNSCSCAKLARPESVDMISCVMGDLPGGGFSLSYPMPY